MHQPHYQDALDGIYHLPWVYLHATKDYSDMVAFLENCPEAKVVVNFVPVLLEQIDDYARMIQAWLQQQTPMQDDMLNLLAGAAPIPADISGRKQLLENCQKAFAPMMIEPFPAFSHLLDMVKRYEENDELFERSLLLMSDQFFVDLLVWYHLAWMGQSVVRNDERIQELFAKQANFDSADQRKLLTVMQEVIASIIPRYRKLMESGQIEISSTPYCHPIVPLLLDFESMRDALPHAPAPVSPAYPDGLNRARWHMEKGLEIFEQHFGQKPSGIWLSEGAISPAAVDLLDEYNIKWTASGEGVWRHSAEQSHFSHEDLQIKRQLYQPLRHGEQKCSLFFRDDGLSDCIGFQYKDWDPLDAANNFSHHIENIANSLSCCPSEHVVSVILDGENAWEYYPDNAFHFLTCLYDRLTKHPRIKMTTYTELLDSGIEVKPLPVLKAGSWVHGSFSTWIGDKEKNQGWDLLVAAKEKFDEVIATGRLSDEQVTTATKQLGICEGSDWFWWFGDYNPSDSVSDFDRLYRRHLTKLYQLLGETPPEILQYPVSKGGGFMENAGTMRRG